ncbi:MAG: class I SAM-dependent methyltransferase, partial [Rhodobacteraceae bacterium]|nr:class I SAM-dependent methyltransferase [Paracoccaceae bacterium]
QAGQTPALTIDGIKATLSLPRETAPLIAAIDGRRTLTDIASVTRTDPIRMGALWTRVEAALVPWGMLLYSNVLR